ncbi:hypothetical protein FIBSPDRAFT_261983 [Athelia psychrophila]|uniref:Uncharacterized protein n=1 Tax=Athelia psychrophila TaxID=1759441 RepID=A0A165XEP9_9AGAM|nr:hypothetical protein FIBSPDRAFT_261983 [Fibularhizoctonia sp. CBS 109695]
MGGASQCGGETSSDYLEAIQSHFSHITNVPLSPGSRIHAPRSQSPYYHPAVVPFRTTSMLGKQHPASSPKPRTGGGRGHARSLRALSVPCVFLSFLRPRTTPLAVASPPPAILPQI